MPKRQDLFWRLAGILGKFILDVIGHTCRHRFLDPHGAQDVMATKRFISAFWHSRILMPAFLHQQWDGAIMVSASKDGEIIARIIVEQGNEPIRGSSKKGGKRALTLLAEKLKERTRPGVIIPDGPQGPRRKVRPGIIQLAKETGYPIVPITYSAKRAKVFGSWDRFMLPWPFTETTVVWGRPLTVNPDGGDGDDAVAREALEREMNRITDWADRVYGRSLP
jgi:lysophospholipid acyltransferase (LPLAT)-like uncharacterized protein